jgi:hypothetical protein
MYNLQTKEQRTNAQEAQFTNLLNNGYSREDYKGLKIFTKNDGKYFTLKLFRNNGAHAIQYMNYRTEERRAEAIQGYKKSYDRNETYKAEAKANKTISTHANTASAIRTELKTLFPFTKFSVTSETFAGGNSVHVSWEDGATSDKVNDIIKKYQYGHFDGMTDMYEYSNNIEGLPQVKYVQGQRSMSKEVGETIKEELRRKYTLEYFEGLSEYEKHNLIYREFQDRDLQPIKEAKQPQPTATATQPQGEAGNVQIIDYSDKAIAVIGETKTIKDTLKNLGGKFNFRLSCGAGWIFPKTKLNEVVTALQAVNNKPKEEEKETEQENKIEVMPTLPTVKEIEVLSGIIPTPSNVKFKLDTFRIIWHEGYQLPCYENTTYTNWDAVQEIFYNLWDINERGKDGGYTKVKCEIKIHGFKSIVIRIDITDKFNNGDFNPSFEHIVTYLETFGDDEFEKENVISTSNNALLLN